MHYFVESCVFVFFQKNRLDKVFTHVLKKFTEGFTHSLYKVHLVHTVSLGKGEG